MDLREKLLEAARPHHCGITDCQYCRWGREDVLKGARLALEAVKEGFLSPSNVCDLDDIDALLASLSTEGRR
jgi:hypothetical protein